MLLIETEGGQVRKCIAQGVRRAGEQPEGGGGMPLGHQVPARGSCPRASLWKGAEIKVL